MGRAKNEWMSERVGAFGNSVEQYHRLCGWMRTKDTESAWLGGDGGGDGVRACMYMQHTILKIIQNLVVVCFRLDYKYKLLKKKSNSKYRNRRNAPHQDCVDHPLLTQFTKRKKKQWNSKYMKSDEKPLLLRTDPWERYTRKTTKKNGNKQNKLGNNNFLS